MIEANIDPDVPGMLEQPIHQRPIERGQRRSTAEHDYLGACVVREVREFERDISRAYEYNPPGQRVELHEFRARNGVRFAGDVERSRRGARRDHDVPRRKLTAANREAVLRDELCFAVQSLDPRLLERRFAARRHWIGKAALECHERRPVDECLARHSVTLHAALPRHDVGSSDEYLLRIAATIATGAAIGLVVHYCHAPASGATAIRGCGASRSGAEHDQVEFVVHGPLALVNRPEAA